MTTPRTYWHLEGRSRRPTAYEIASSRLSWWPQLGFAVATPMTDWYRRHVLESRLRSPDWERFHDPAELTYARYVEVAAEREAFLEALFASDGARVDPRPEQSREDLLVAALAPLRFACHGLQMVAAYLGSMAPASRVTIAAAFQAADELRRVHRVAQRVAELEPALPGIAERSRAAWQHDAAWQPLRALLERLLVTYDFGECFAALALVVKPRLDELLVRQLARVVRAAGGDLDARLLDSFEPACRWHGEWSAALVRALLAAEPQNAAVLQEWVADWTPRAHAAVAAFRPRLARAGHGTAARGVDESDDFDAILAATTAAQAALLASAGLEVERIFAPLAAGPAAAGTGGP